MLLFLSILGASLNDDMGVSTDQIDLEDYVTISIRGIS